ncbi:MAG: PIN protein [uncultured bacterium]|uniref:Ribonuclease VapC n=1 Tax=candidate division WWE3 bacterium RBG_16_37_10 TaxID=1802610 RepID=A0A1F4V2W4_UNCKA|nr:MAG: PIN protein [uncultured bacterium]OGC51410.1 MAG: hypothetical protein A2W32_01120 [candidate division WWE3 bacterium RBG_16_37_10]
MSSPEYLLDTNILIEAFLGIEPAAYVTRNLIGEGKISFSVITIAEFLSKAARQEAESFKALIKVFGVLPVDYDIAVIAANYRKMVLKKTKRAFLADCLIADTAKFYDLRLVTHNISDYPMKDIKVLKPDMVK